MMHRMPICAGSNENFINFDSFESLAFFETDVFQCTRHTSRSSNIHRVTNDRSASGNRCNVLGTGSPGDGRGNVLGLDEEGLVVFGSLVTLKAVPMVDCLVPFFAGGRHGASLQVFVGDLVGGNDTGTGAGLDGHVGNTHSGLHTQGFDGSSSELDGKSGTSSGSDYANDVKNDVLGADSLSQGPIDTDEHVLGLGLR